MKKGFWWWAVHTWSYSRERWDRFRDPFGVFEMVWGHLKERFTRR